MDNFSYSSKSSLKFRKIDDKYVRDEKEALAKLNQNIKSYFDE